MQRAILKNVKEPPQTGSIFKEPSELILNKNVLQKMRVLPNPCWLAVSRFEEKIVKNRPQSGMVDYVPDEIKAPKTARIFTIPKSHIFDKHSYQWGTQGLFMWIETSFIQGSRSKTSHLVEILFNPSLRDYFQC